VVNWIKRGFRLRRAETGESEVNQSHRSAVKNVGLTALLTATGDSDSV
jgi:hypothetical protein